MLKRLYSDPTDKMDLDEGVWKGLTFTPPHKVNKPTYEIVGPVERMDFRDIPAFRRMLIPGTPQFDNYYSRHPELKDSDDKLRKHAYESARKRADKDLLNERLSAAGFYGQRAINRPDIINDRIVHRGFTVDIIETPRAEIDPALMSKKVKAFGLHMGAAKVGIAELNQDWVYSYHFSDEPNILDYKYIICMAFLMDPFMQSTQTGMTHNFEVGLKYSYASLASVMLGNAIRNLGWRAKPLPPAMPAFVVPTFIDAGIGEQGRMGIVVSKEFGNAFRPGAVATDMPLVTDKPVDFGLQDFCEKCQVCADTCPANAITKGGKEVVRGVRRWNVDDDKCTRFCNSINRPCGVCQSVCPWNHRNNMFHNTIRELGEHFSGLRKMLILGEKIFYRHKRGPEVKWLTDLI